VPKEVLDRDFSQPYLSNPQVRDVWLAVQSVRPDGGTGSEMNIVEGTGPEYAAFLSYASADDAVARRLHKALEKYRLPRGVADSEAKGRRNLLYPVFRDRDEAASDELGGRLREALRASRALVVMCSPHAATSEWIDAEVRYFQELGKGDKIFAYIVDGEPNASAQRGVECLPPALRADQHRSLSDDVPQGVLAADARPGRDGPHRAFLKLVAGILNLNLGRLIDCEARRRRWRQLQATAAAIALSVATAFGGALFIQNQNQKARQLTKEAMNLLTPGRSEEDRYSAIRLAIAARAGHVSRAIVPEVRSVLGVAWSTRDEGWPIVVFQTPTVDYTPELIDQDHLMIVEGARTLGIYSITSRQRSAEYSLSNADIIDVSASSQQMTGVVAASDGLYVFIPDVGLRNVRPIKLTPDARICLALTAKVAFAFDGRSNFSIVEIPSGRLLSSMDVSRSVRLARPDCADDGQTVLIHLKKAGAMIWRWGENSLVSVGAPEDRAGAISDIVLAPAINKLVYARSSGEIRSLSMTPNGSETLIQKLADPPKILCVSRSGRFVMSFSPTLVSLRDMVSNSSRTLVLGASHPVGAVFTADDKTVAVLSQSSITNSPWNAIRIFELFDTSSGQRIESHEVGRTAGGHRTALTWFRYLETANVLLALDKDGTLLKWNLDKTKAMHFPLHGAWVKAAFPSPTGDQLFSVDGNGVGIMWNLRTNSALFLLEGNSWTATEGRHAQSLFDARGDRIVFVDQDNVANVYDSKTGQKIVALCYTSSGGGCDTKAEFASFSPSSKFVVTAGFHGVEVWSGDAAKLLWVGQISSARLAVFNRDETYLAVYSNNGSSVSSDRKISLFSVDNFGKIADLQIPQGASDELHGIHFNPAGSRLLFSAQNIGAIVWDVATRDRVLAVGSDHGAINKVTSPTKISDIETVSSASFVGQPERLVIWGGDPGIGNILSASDWSRAAHSMVNQSGEVKRLAVSGDGSMAVTASGDGTYTARIWDLTEQVELARFFGHPEPIEDLRFMPDRRSIVSTSRDNTARIWLVPPDVDQLLAESCRLLPQSERRFREDELRKWPELHSVSLPCAETK
jgi:WD40 repeat protein